VLLCADVARDSYDEEEDESAEEEVTEPARDRQQLIDRYHVCLSLMEFFLHGLLPNNFAVYLTYQTSHCLLDTWLMTKCLS